LLAAAPAAAQQNQGALNEATVGEAAAQGDTPDQNTIVVTGTRRTDRTVAESPVPVDVLSADSLTNTGFTEVTRALTQEVPSFNFPQPSITDGTDVIRPATLRGLGPDQTLVLINGKRRHSASLLNINGSVGRGTSAVDINMIPTIALSRVEVLRDGAAAQYGSDAIAGVINFQLRRAPRGGRASVTYGRYATNVAGIGDVAGVLRGANNAPVLAPDGTLSLNFTGSDRYRSDGQTVTLAAVWAVPISREGYFNIAGEFQDRNHTNRTGADPRRQYAPLAGGALDPREFTFNRFSHRYGDPEVTDYKLWINGGLPVGADVEVYWFGNYNQRLGESAGFYRLPNDARNVPAIYPNGFLPLITTETEDRSLTLGLRGENVGWRWDLSGQYGRNTTNFEIRNSLNRSFGASSQTQFDSGGLRYDQALFNFDASRELGLGIGERTTLSVGAEYRREGYDIRPGEPASYIGGPIPGPSGAQVFPGFQPNIGGASVDQAQSRNSVSAYGEIDTDLTERLNIQGAVRFERYSDFGSELNWKLAGRFEPLSGLAVRASASTGFRAPSLQQQFFAARATNNVAGVLLETVTLPVDNPVAIALGASPLEAEHSRSLAAGLVFTAVPRLSVTLDAYRIDIDDRIVVTDNLTATRNPATREPTGANPGLSVARILNQAGFLFVDAARFFVNGVDTRTTGVDFVTTYRFPDFAGGRLNLTGGFNYNKTEIRRFLAAPGPLANIPNLVLFGRQESLRLEQGQPRTKINLSGTFERDWLGTTLRTTRYGKVLDAGGVASGVQDIELEPRWITDAELRVRPGDRGLELAFGANNLFDQYPTITLRGLAVDPVSGATVTLPATRYPTPFSNFSPFGFNGRYLYARASLNF
jgi:iron complex outermembrane receptor protein